MESKEKNSKIKPMPMPDMVKNDLPFDAWEKYQQEIINKNTKLMKEFQTLPKIYVKAYQSLMLVGEMYAGTREKRVGAMMREIERNGIAFEVTENKGVYLTRNINYVDQSCFYSPRIENNRLCLFYLAYQKVIKEYRITNHEDVISMQFILKDNKLCKAVVLPKNIKASNKIMEENEKALQKQIAAEEKELKTIYEETGKEHEAIQLGYELFYLVTELEFAKKLNLENKSGRLSYPNESKNPNLQWSPDLKNLAYYGNAKISEVLKLIKKGVAGYAHQV